MTLCTMTMHSAQRNRALAAGYGRADRPALRAPERLCPRPTAVHNGGRARRRCRPCVRRPRLHPTTGVAAGARPRFGLPAHQSDAFITADGHDIRTWDGYPILHEIRELSTLNAVLRGGHIDRAAGHVPGRIDPHRFLEDAERRVAGHIEREQPWRWQTALLRCPACEAARHRLPWEIRGGRDIWRCAPSVR
jgi:hypothetical protein